MASKPRPSSSASRKRLDLDQVDLISQLKERGLKSLELARVTFGGADTESADRPNDVSRVAEVQDRIADAFAKQSKDDLTTHVLASLTLSALSLT